MTPPPKKRESTSEANEEVCKRLKNDINSNKQPSTTSTTDNTSEEETKLNINNNNSSKNNKNGSLAVVKTDTTHESAGDPGNNSKKEDDELDKAKLNGANKDEEQKSVKESDKNKPSEPTNGGNSEPHDEKQIKKATPSGTEEPPVKTEEAVVEEEDEEESEPTGMLLICGGANWDMTGRKELPKAAKKPVKVDPAARNLWGPHRVNLDGSDVSLRVKGVFSGCNACHSVIVTDEGVTMSFGRNDKGQLGVGDTETRTTPVVVEALNGLDIIAAACGRSHTLFLSSDGLVFACGDNKMGQCGTNQMSVHTLTTPARIAFKENKRVVKIACGAEFSMIADNEGRLYSFGHPEHGQLGHNSEGKYFTTGNKYAFHCEYQPRRIVTFIEKSREGHVSPVDDVFITEIACGTNHTLAVDKNHRCFSWGFAGYHRLGHSETKNELVPRSIKVFDAPSNSGRGAAKVFAGASHSMALDVNGLLYFWGQNKSSGEATMYPKNVQDLCGWRIKAVSCANRSIFVIADDTSISWGPSPTYGELGYGEGKSKSSTTPQEVRTLDNVKIMDVACGFGHTLLIANDKKDEEKALLKKQFKTWP